MSKVIVAENMGGSNGYRGGGEWGPAFTTLGNLLIIMEAGSVYAMGGSQDLEYTMLSGASEI